MDFEYAEKIIDLFLLRFLDSFEVIYGRLPNQEEKTIWVAGFIDGMNAIETFIHRE